jgi:hypothetical protein
MELFVELPVGGRPTLPAEKGVSMIDNFDVGMIYFRGDILPIHRMIKGP